MIVVDASVIVPSLLATGPGATSTRRRLEHQQLAAPEVIDLEVLSALRRLVRAGRLTPPDAHRLVGELPEVPIARAAHTHLAPRCWELRDNVTPYDAAYVALAELLGCPLLTGDRRLARAPGIRCRVEVLS